MLVALYNAHVLELPSKNLYTCPGIVATKEMIYNQILAIWPVFQPHTGHMAHTKPS
jgi:hypothetical protein